MKFHCNCVCCIEKKKATKKTTKQNSDNTSSFNSDRGKVTNIQRTPLKYIDATSIQMNIQSHNRALCVTIYFNVQHVNWNYSSSCIM